MTDFANPINSGAQLANPFTTGAANLLAQRKQTQTNEAVGPLQQQNPARNVRQNSDDPLRQAEEELQDPRRRRQRTNVNTANTQETPQADQLRQQVTTPTTAKADLTQNVSRPSAQATAEAPAGAPIGVAQDRGRQFNDEDRTLNTNSFAISSNNTQQLNAEQQTPRRPNQPTQNANVMAVTANNERNTNSAPNAPVSVDQNTITRSELPPVNVYTRPQQQREDITTNPPTPRQENRAINLQPFVSAAVSAAVSTPTAEEVVPERTPPPVSSEEKEEEKEPIARVVTLPTAILAARDKIENPDPPPARLFSLPPLAKSQSNNDNGVADTNDNTVAKATNVQNQRTATPPENDRPPLQLNSTRKAQQQITEGNADNFTTYTVRLEQRITKIETNPLSRSEDVAPESAAVAADQTGRKAATTAERAITKQPSNLEAIRQDAPPLDFNFQPRTSEIEQTERQQENADDRVILEQAETDLRPTSPATNSTPQTPPEDVAEAQDTPRPTGEAEASQAEQRRNENIFVIADNQPRSSAAPRNPAVETRVLSQRQDDLGDRIAGRTNQVEIAENNEIAAATQQQARVEQQQQRTDNIDRVTTEQTAARAQKNDDAQIDIAARQSSQIIARQEGAERFNQSVDASQATTNVRVADNTAQKQQQIAVDIESVNSRQNQTQSIDQQRADIRITVGQRDNQFIELQAQTSQPVDNIIATDTQTQNPGNQNIVVNTINQDVETRTIETQAVLRRQGDHNISQESVAAPQATQQTPQEATTAALADAADNPEVITIQPPNQGNVGADLGDTSEQTGLKKISGTA